jgi:thiol-disulfide isomerase/thioredoxin
VAAGLIAAGCGSSADEDSTAASKPAPASGAATADESKPGKKIPDALAANRAQANQILDEGQLEPKLEELRGHPVVVNQWASWCPPCRAEFPYFQESAEAHADEVAFLGIDMQDERGAAEAFLRELPVPYPTIDDPNAAQIGSLGGGVVSPTTVFIDEEGEIVSVFQGVYTSQEQLEADIERNLLS